MTTSVLDRVPLDAITHEASEVRTGRAILTAIAGVFFAVGWLAGRAVPVLLWCCFAIREGFRAAHGPSRKMRIASLEAQIAEMKIQLSRFDVR